MAAKYLTVMLLWSMIQKSNATYSSVCIEEELLGKYSGNTGIGELKKINMPLCTQNSCNASCSCTWGNCSQACTATLVCPQLTCHANDSCVQSAANASYLSKLICNAGLECIQTLNHTAADTMKATSGSISQIYRNRKYRLKEMKCDAMMGTFCRCKQSCDNCLSTKCNASNCQIACTDCGTIFCGGNQTCKHTCQVQCNQTVCNSNKCNIVCEAGSKCRDVQCGDNVKHCSLDCMEGATCNLNCSFSETCQHTCARNGLCSTWVGEHLDVHDGQCEKCNCTDYVRNCIQRCETTSGRCLEMYCNASNSCDLFSRSTGKSFVYLMKSTAPNGRLTCDNGSECWQMLCYGPNCSLICDNGARCDYMICRGENCTFICKNGAVCDVVTCLPGSNHCTYECDATSNCRHKRCRGDHCVGADKYSPSTASLSSGHCIFMPLLFLLFISFNYLIPLYV